mmetsp:Transcript_46153/g.96014  ORF Transcript_46153/g.96014 Transcript_46153/m.96014 type:complete len:113 (+) Transcript_46153:3-341(+)
MVATGLVGVQLLASQQGVVSPPVAGLEPPVQPPAQPAVQPPVQPAAPAMERSSRAGRQLSSRRAQLQQGEKPVMPEDAGLAQAKECQVVLTHKVPSPGRPGKWEEGDFVYML